MRILCPCGRLNAKKQPLFFEACCGQYLIGGLNATDAESLMRSRYSAYVFEKAEYLLSTWHVSQRPQSLEFETNVKRLGLEIRHQAVTDPQHAQVTFVARQRDQSGRAIRVHERSRFVCENDHWYYVDGDNL